MSGSKAVGPTMYGAVRHPAQMGGPAVEADLTNMARPRVHRRLPVVLSQGEIAAVFQALQGEHRLLAQVLQGTGMRLFEGLQPRIKDVDFSHQTIVVRCGKGGKDRLLMLPPRLVQALREQVARAHMAWKQGRQAACDMRTVQDLLGHADVTTTMHYTHVLKVSRWGRGRNKLKPRCRTAGQSKQPPANLRESRPVAAP
jgi:site-specific recombinase XerD